MSESAEFDRGVEASAVIIESMAQMIVVLNKACGIDPLRGDAKAHHDALTLAAEKVRPLKQ